MNEATRQYILTHANDDVRQLALRGTKDPLVDLPYALQQIDGRQRARRKLPSWAAMEGLIYPPHLSLEQCSSEHTARYKASIAGEGLRCVDLTAGFGVDAAWISRQFQHAVCVEQQAVLCEVAKQNFALLGLTHVSVVHGDGIDYLHTMEPVDLIYVDPARRDAHGGRTYGMADCTPNVLEMLDEMVEKSDRLLIKLSPMLDWRKAVDEVKGCGHAVSEVHMVSVDNECKELLLLVERGRRKVEGDVLRVVCVNLLSDGSVECFDYSPSTFHQPLLAHRETESCLPTYLYEPNASIMKAGCFDLVAARFGLSQLDVNSHLFVGAVPVEHFPGRMFTVERRCSMNKRELRVALEGVSRANIAVRNFPMTVAELRQRLRLRDGGDIYIFATTVANQGHQLFVCRKIA